MRRADWLLRLLLDAGMYDEDVDSGFAHWACMSKARYESYSAGLRVLRLRLGMAGSATLYCYRCGTCDGYHLTKKPQFGIRKAKQKVYGRQYGGSNAGVQMRSAHA